MRKIILYVAVSLDGYIARTDGAVDWLDAYSDRDYGYKAFINSVDCAILGHNTYLKSLSFGPDVFKGRPHYVFTRASSQVDHDTVIFVREDPTSFVEKLRKEPGQDIWMMGGGLLLSDFLVRGLIDEMILFVMPEVLGSGIPLFPAQTPQHRFTLANTVGYDNGVVFLHYKNGS